VPGTCTSGVVEQIASGIFYDGLYGFSSYDSEVRNCLDTISFITMKI